MNLYFNTNSPIYVGGTRKVVTLDLCANCEMSLQFSLFLKNFNFLWGEEPEEVVPYNPSWKLKWNRLLASKVIVCSNRPANRTD